MHLKNGKKLYNERGITFFHKTERYVNNLNIYNRSKNGTNLWDDLIHQSIYICCIIILVFVLYASVIRLLSRDKSFDTIFNILEFPLSELFFVEETFIGVPRPPERGCRVVPNSYRLKPPRWSSWRLVGEPRDHLFRIATGALLRFLLDSVIGNHPCLIGPLGGTTPPDANLPGPSCKFKGETRSSSAWRHSRWVLSSHPFSLGALGLPAWLARSRNGRRCTLVAPSAWLLLYNRLGGLTLADGES